MTISVLDGRNLLGNPQQPSLGTLHDQAGAVDDERAAVPGEQPGAVVRGVAH